MFFYYVEENQRDPALNLIYQYMRQEAPGIPLYSIYVKNTLLLFFESHQVSYDRMDSYFRSLSSNVAPALEYRRLSFSNLASLLEQLISKIRRYGTHLFYEWFTAGSYLQLPRTDLENGAAYFISS